MWKECLSHKNTLYAHEANDNSNEWVSLLRPTNSKVIRRCGPWFKVQYERLEKPGIELMTPGWQDEKLHTTPPRHNFSIFHTVKYLIKGLQTFHHAPPLHLHQASAMTLLINKKSFKKISRIVFKLQSGQKKRKKERKEKKYYRNH